ncbi:MAG: RnfABCDGE type electron transport complex subunit B [Clostridiales bacterium]|nr:RnfABCDGE type electron transport complex subunit B [Clostridiales bacterium]
MDSKLIISAVIIVSVIGAIAAFILAVASKIFAVPVDEKAEKIRECLPGANCGACGYSGCDGYAAALSSGKETNAALCNPGGNDAAKAISEITGLAAGEIIPSAAVVLCCGFNDNAVQKLEYQGVMSCRMATQAYGGPKECIYGCIGYGDCVNVCEYDAISICNGIARVNPSKCRACKKCTKVCPKGLIEMMPLEVTKAAVVCKNHDKGAVTRKECSAGCIGCMKCVKNCPQQAITIDRFCAKVDYEKCIGCGICHEQCPVGAINIITLAKHA